MRGDVKITGLLICCALAWYGALRASAFYEAVEDSYATRVCIGAEPNYKGWTDEELDCQPPAQSWSKIWESDYDGPFYLTDEERGE